MRIKFTVDRRTQPHAITLEPCDNDMTLERARAGQDLAKDDVIVAAISETEFDVSLVDKEPILRAAAEGFLLGWEHAQEIRRVFLEEFKNLAGFTLR